MNDPSNEESPSRNQNASSSSVINRSTLTRPTNRPSNGMRYSDMRSALHQAAQLRAQRKQTDSNSNQSTPNLQTVDYSNTGGNSSEIGQNNASTTIESTVSETDIQMNLESDDLEAQAPDFDQLFN